MTYNDKIFWAILTSIAVNALVGRYAHNDRITPNDIMKAYDKRTNNSRSDPK